MRYTPEQERAIYTLDRNLIVTAGAGSGKTRVLVDRFLVVLEANPDWPLPSVVAITFTDKAANEMRDRVRRGIEQKIQHAAESGNDTLIRQWRDHQATLDNARIGTIHSLCATILRANAAEAQIDPAFNVLDEIESTILRDEAVEQTISRIHEIGALDLLKDYGVTSVRYAVSDFLARGDAVPTPADYMTVWRAGYERIVSDMLNALRQDGQFQDALCGQLAELVPETDKMRQNWKPVFDYRDHLFASDGTGAYEILQTWCDIKLTGGSASVWNGKENFDIAKRQLKYIRETAERIVAYIKPLDDHDATAARYLLLWQNLLLEAQKTYQSLKRKQSAVDFNDLETFTRQLLQKEQVAQRYRNTEFRHILVDEFQDTNRAQCDIIEALVDIKRPGSLFIVGDPRQSIYAFRGADVSVFSDIQQRLGAVGGEVIALNRSFRTHRRLVDGFNHVFSSLMVRREGTNAAYHVGYEEGMIAERNADDMPCVELILIDKELSDQEKLSVDEQRRWEAAVLAERLRALVESGQQVWDRERDTYRPIRYGDMAILFRATRQMLIVEDALKSLEIPYVTVAGRGYYDRSEVWDLINLLNALYNPADDLSLASVLRSPLYGLSDDDLFALRLQYTADSETGKSKRLSLWNALTDPDRQYDPPLPEPDQVRFARESLQRLHQVAGRITIAELLIRALEDTAYLATLSALPDGARRCGNVEKLIELARSSGRIVLGEFTLYLKDLSEREAREGEALVAAGNAVQLMTIHASKGLEFPLVAIFNASKQKPRIETMPLVIDPVIGAACCVYDENGEKVEPFAYRLAKQYREEREQAEQIRLLYVAMTRAQDYVIVSGQRNDKQSWLSSLVETLGVPKEIEGDEAVVSLTWGDCVVRIPTALADTAERYFQAEWVNRRDTITGWDDIKQGTIPGIDPVVAPLLQAVQLDRRAPTRQLTATEIAALGEAKVLRKPARFRHRILRDSPPEVKQVTTADPGPFVPERVIGNIVHQALRWWRLPSNTPGLRQILDSYVWEQGVTDPQMIENAIRYASELLERTERSDIVGHMLQAREIYRELPFSFTLNGRTINGVIDALFLSKYGQWHVVDYKTSGVTAGDDLYANIREHAKRYYLQMGIYAAAIEAMTGQAPEVHIHYIRYVYTAKIAEQAWREVLVNLDNDIEQALRD